MIEGEVKLHIPKGKPTKKSPVFYNPVIALQRDINISLLKALGRKNLRIADVMAGSGVRSIRVDFLSLRFDPHAQKEIYQYAAIISEFVQRLSPSTFEAFMKYKKNAVTFTEDDTSLLAALIVRSGVNPDNLELYRPMGYVIDVKNKETGEKTGEKLNREGEELQKKILAIIEAGRNADLRERITGVLSALRPE